MVAIVPGRDGSSQEENLQVAPRQAARNAQARGSAPERVPGLPPSEAATPRLSHLQYVPRARGRAAAGSGPVESAPSDSPNASEVTWQRPETKSSSASRKFSPSG